MTKPKVCIVSPFCYPLFNPEIRGAHFGGWEVRTYTIAKELARRGNVDVSMVVWDHGQPPVEQRAGVTLYAWQGKPNPHRDPADSVRAETGTPVSDGTAGADVPLLARAEFDHWLAAHTHKLGRWLLRALAQGVILSARAGLQFVVQLAVVWRDVARRVGWLLREPFGYIGNYIVAKKDVAIYDRINADIYMMPGNNYTAGELAYYCRARGKKYVFLAGSDPDYDPAFRLDLGAMGLYSVPNYLRVYAIESATAHIAQNARQVATLKNVYGRDAVLIRNPLDLTPAFPRNPAAQTILWVGSSDDRVRRPSRMLDLAERLPEYQFVMVMVPLIAETDRACWARARALPNVTMFGRTPFAEIERFFADAKLFVNTSVFEGFPNTFLQAAKYGVPIVTLKVDPGEMLSQHGCGIASGDDLERLSETVRRMMTDAELYARASAACQRYVRAYHDQERIIPQYEQVFNRLLA